MMIVRIFQGPGNQLFQYAYGLAASKRVGTELKLDLSWFDDHSGHRPYILDRFRITAKVATADEIAYIRACNGPNFLQYRYNLMRNSLAERHRKAIVEEDLSRYHAELKHPYRNSHIKGYFSSELFFQDQREQVRKELVFKDDAPASSARIMEDMDRSSAVAVSIRRGDFLQNPLHNICSVQYYQRAIGHIRKTVSEPQLYIFSDEPDWVKQNMGFDAPSCFIEEPRDPVEHLRMMSCCRFHAIPNSTFSWWGAWLSDPEVVVAPEFWLSSDRETHSREFGHWVETGHTVPQSWQRIPNFLKGEDLMVE